MNPLQRQVHLVRRRRELLAPLGEEVAKHIFEDILQGDDLQDRIDDVVVSLYPEIFDDVEGYDEVELLDDLIDSSWDYILGSLQSLIRDNRREAELRKEARRNQASD